MFGDQSGEGSGAGTEEEEFSSAVLGSEESVGSPEPEAEGGVDALPAWAEDVLELVAEGARLTAAQDRQVTLALDLRKEQCLNPVPATRSGPSRLTELFSCCRELLLW